MSTKKNPHVYTIKATELARLIRPVMPFAEATSYGLPILNAVHLTSADGYLVARATDRYCIGIQRVAVEGAKPGLAFSLPLAAAKSMLAMFKPARQADPELTLTFTTDSVPEVRVVATGGFALMDSGSMAWSGVPGDYPRVTDALDKGVKATEIVSLNPHLLTKFAVAQKLGEPMKMQMAGPLSPVLVSIGDDFVGAIQPVRNGDEPVTIWTGCITEAPEKKKAVA